MKSLVLFFLFMLTLPAFGGSPSAFRQSNKPATAYYPLGKGALSESAFGQRVSRSKLDISKVPNVTDGDFIRAKFETLRDKRFLQQPGSDFDRRITWLYPDDGCYARAEVLTDLLEKEHAPTPAKVFAFGELRAKTKNSPRGFVSWWYHVAVSYRINDVVYIFDPSLEPKRPLPLDEWIGLISPQPANVTVSICSSHTYEPESDCFDPGIRTDMAYDTEQENYLQREWDRLKDLGRNPERELGEFPPWL